MQRLLPAVGHRFNKPRRGWHHPSIQISYITLSGFCFCVWSSFFIIVSSLRDFLRCYTQKRNVNYPFYWSRTFLNFWFCFRSWSSFFILNSSLRDFLRCYTQKWNVNYSFYWSRTFLNFWFSFNPEGMQRLLPAVSHRFNKPRRGDIIHPFK